MGRPKKTAAVEALKGTPTTIVRKAKTMPDFSTHLDRARGLAARLGEQADKETDPKRAVGIARQYREMMEQVRRLELAAPKILLEQGKVIDRATAEKEIGEAAALINGDLTGIPAKVAGRLVGKTAGEIMVILKQEIGEAMRHLSGLAGVDAV